MCTCAHDHTNILSLAAAHQNDHYLSLLLSLTHFLPTSLLLEKHTRFFPSAINGLFCCIFYIFRCFFFFPVWSKSHTLHQNDGMIFHNFFETFKHGFVFSSVIFPGRLLKAPYTSQAVCESVASVWYE